MNIDDKKQEISTFLMSKNSKQQLKMALPQVGITPEKMIRLIFSSFSQNNQLIKCEKKSIFNAMIMCASLGLEPNTPLGHAYLIPYRNNKTGIYECNFQIGYRGLMVLARRSGEIINWVSRIVYEDDFFEYQMGTDEYIKHRPHCSEDIGDIIYAYSIVKFRDNNSSSFEIMTKNQIDSIRKRSKTSNNGPWVTDYEAMARKTVMRRHSNHLPLTIELAKVVALDGKNEAGDKNFSGIIDLDTSIGIENDNNNEPSLEKMAHEHNKTITLSEKQQKVFSSIPTDKLIVILKQLKIKKDINELDDSECTTILDLLREEERKH